MGSSLGGLISLHIADTYPDRYDFVASLSGTLGWGRFGQENPVMEEIYVAAGHRDFAIYVDSGGDDGGDGCDDADGDGFVEDDPNDGDNYCANRAFADAMAGNGYTWEQDLWHWHDAGAEHNEAAWAGRVDMPLSIFLSLD
jgi:S-formylglutathione hydrolase FrmB